MPKPMDAEKAAIEILRMINANEAKDAADAVSKKPELKAGQKMMQDAVKEKPKKKSVGRRMAAAATGSGPATFDRTASAPPPRR